ncbi:MAG: hypothetical protein K2K08_03505 [Paramuribaculum sp.]|nr:hypothetical protein [Paramuribaculum sp.]
MAEKESKEKQKEREERLSLTKEELQNMKFKFSIEVPKGDFDELLKAMMGIGDNRPDNS